MVLPPAGGRTVVRTSSFPSGTGFWPSASGARAARACVL